MYYSCHHLCLESQPLPFMRNDTQCRTFTTEVRSEEESMQDKNAEALLSQREREVMLLAVEGLTTREMAQALDISPATIKTHLLKIYRKAGIKNRVQLVRLVAAL